MMTIGLRLNNPFDLESSSAFTWAGEIKPSSHAPFCQFDSMANGIRAGFLDLINAQKKHGYKTIAELVPHFAPPSENDTAAYIKAVCDGTDIDAHSPIDLTDYDTLLKVGYAFADQEQGDAILTVDNTLFQDGARQALTVAGLHG